MSVNQKYPLSSSFRFVKASSSLRTIQRKLFLIVILILAALLSTEIASAHTRIQLGDYTIVVGWLYEPAIVGERTSLIISVQEGSEIIQGLESTLAVELLYAGRNYRANLTPADANGWYAIDVLPTIRGQYTLHIAGFINNFQIDELIEPDEIMPADVLEFPQSQPDNFAQQVTIEQLQDDLQIARLLAIGGVGVGVLSLLGVGFVMSTRRSKSA